MADLARPSDDYRKTAVIGFAVIVSTFVVMGAWGVLTPLSAAVVGGGTVTNGLNRQTIQTAQSGIVREILIHEGEHVRRGQPLFEFDPVQAEAVMNISKNELFSLLAKGDRLAAERDGTAVIRWSPELTAAGADPIARVAIIDEQRQFNERRETLQSQTAVLQSRIGELESQIQGLDVQRTSANQQAAFLDEEITGLEKLYEEDLVPKPRLLELKRARADLGGQTGRLVATKAEAQKSIGEVKLQIRDLQQKFQASVSQESAEVQTRSTDVRQKFSVASDQRRRIEVTAPVNGTVQGLRVFTQGAVLREAEPMVEIAPDKGDMVLEARFQPKDVNVLRPGMRTELNFSSFHDRTIPVIFGRIQSISQDRLTEPSQHMDYYLAVVQVNQDSLPERMRGHLKAGMPVTVTVPIGEQTAWEMMSQPLTGAFGKSFRER